MNEVALLEVGHGPPHLNGHLKEDGGREDIPGLGSQVVQEVPVTHELCDDVVGWLLGADA